jgi:hypothetical protein
MQSTVDHTNVSELARLIGVDYTPNERGKQSEQACGAVYAVDANES